MTRDDIKVDVVQLALLMLDIPDDDCFHFAWADMPQRDRENLPRDVFQRCLDRSERSPFRKAQRNAGARPDHRANGAAIELAVPLGESAFALLERDLPEPERLCDPWATEGLNIIAGRPKLGKTTLARQKLAAASNAADFLDSQFISPVKCAFLCLEEGERLTKSKFKRATFPDAALAGITIHYTWPRGREGADLLDRYLDENPEVRFVCIDSLSRFRTVPDAKTPAFVADYEAMTQLHDVATRHPGIVIDVIHHTRKMKSEDPIDDINGTYGLTAAVDSYMVLRPHTDGGLLMYAGGRLWERDVSEYQLRKNAQRWEMVGKYLGLTSEQELLLEIIKHAHDGVSGLSIANDFGITKQSAWERLNLLIAKGVAIKRAGKVYVKDHMS
jgi:hypothetical protein